MPMTNAIRTLFRRMRTLSLLTTALVWGAPAALAYPDLQLNVLGGAYDSLSETVVTTDNRFTVQAYATKKRKKLTRREILDGSFFLAVAVAPESEGSIDFGTFSINGVEVGLGDMTYGRPEALPPHGTYDAYYHLKGFRFDADDTAKAFNTADHAGRHPDDSGKKMYVASFDVDASGLTPGTGLHFDLFGGTPADGNISGPVTYNFANLQRIRFAPFSHDAAMVPGSNETVAVSEPGSLAVFGASLVALVILRRRSAVARRPHLG